LLLFEFRIKYLVVCHRALQPTNCIYAARDLELVRPLLMIKNTENLVLNEIIASAWERSQNRWRFRTRQPVTEDY